jgi:CubicO group peptidase (beta-lactamase class C family)
MVTKKRMFFVLMIAVLVLPALASLPSATAQGSLDIDWPTNGWQTSTPEQQGMNSEMLAGLWNRLLVGETGDTPPSLTPKAGSTFIHTALVIRHGNAVLDASVYPFSNAKPHELFSATKSVLSTLVGIAVDQGYIESVDQSIWEFFSKEGTANMDEQKATITLRNLLTHTSGLSIGIPTATGVWDTGGKTYTQYVLDSPMETAPGSAYLYQDGNADLVSALLQQATGMTAAEFAEKNLFAPLGITDADWVADPEGVNWGGWGLALSGYDLAKIGYLFLHNGAWDGQQIVSSTWIETSINDQLEPLQPHFWEGYSNYWYNGPIGYWFNEPEGKNAPYRGYAAIGWGTQVLLVVPDLDLILVVTGDLGNLGMFSGLTDFIVPSVESTEALPDNPEAFAKLKAALEATGKPIPSAVPTMPNTAQTISGKTFTLANNPLGWTSLSMTFGDEEAALILGVGDSHLEFPVGLDGVFRVSSVSLPTDPIFWAHSNVPLAITGSWMSEQVFSMELWDLMGNQGMVITIPFDTLNITATPILFQELTMAFQGAPQ